MVVYVQFLTVSIFTVYSAFTIGFAMLKTMGILPFSAFQWFLSVDKAEGWSHSNLINNKCDMTKKTVERSQTFG